MVVLAVFGVGLAMGTYLGLLFGIQLTEKSTKFVQAVHEQLILTLVHGRNSTDPAPNPPATPPTQVLDHPPLPELGPAVSKLADEIESMSRDSGHPVTRKVAMQQAADMIQGIYG